VGPDPDDYSVAKAVASQLPGGEAKAIVGEMCGFRASLQSSYLSAQPMGRASVGVVTQVVTAR